ncbi:HK97-gp10 family putative phage morphogenesis protein [Janthinobacterium fluminis]|uniref:HK97 gp10 family phage protein n=1 Tax=Janthinobacterium fluminis TaxID=2987524 RepID=A0ABT5JUE4_9BURK|nr:HK97-gp10 family putative phage morphogenesis protein [Janthinobacterium fluminis]MDC8756259.1 HK97 gp10 family phage protein [Janthinobacterium fluminis]
MTFKIDIAQLAGLSGQIQKFGQKVQDEVAIAGVAAMATVVYTEVKLNASKNKKSGLLLSAIYRKYSPEKSGDARQTYRVSWNKRRAPHGHLLEFGTSRAPAYPFIRPSLSKLPDAIDAGRTRIAEKLAELGGKS